MRYGLMLLFVMGLWVGCSTTQQKQEQTPKEAVNDGNTKQESVTEPAKEAPVDAGLIEKKNERIPEKGSVDQNTPDTAKTDTASTDKTLPEKATEPTKEAPAKEAPVEQPTPDLGISTCPLSDDCEQLKKLFQKEMDRIQHCNSPDDCGQSLAGTSCGCTRNKVAAKNADITCFKKMLAHGAKKGCELGGISTCDCPPTNGFLCTNNRCAWNYIKP